MADVANKQQTTAWF